MAKMNVCIVTYYDAAYGATGSLCEESVRHYAERYGYAVRIAKTPFMKDLPAQWQKIGAIRACFEAGYEWALWIDADAIFSDYGRDIGCERLDGAELLLTRYAVYGEKGYVLNTGVMLLRNTPRVLEFLAYICGMQEYYSHIWAENAAMMDCLGIADDLPPSYRRHLPASGRQKKSAASVSWLGGEWNSIPHYAIPTGNPVIVHYAGRHPATRLWGLSGIAYRTRIISLRGFLLRRMRAAWLYMHYRMYHAY